MNREIKYNPIAIKLILDELNKKIKSKKDINQLMIEEALKKSSSDTCYVLMAICDIDELSEEPYYAYWIYGYNMEDFHYAEDKDNEGDIVKKKIIGYNDYGFCYYFSLTFDMILKKLCIYGRDYDNDMERLLKTEEISSCILTKDELKNLIKINDIIGHSIGCKLRLANYINIIKHNL